MYRSGRGKIYQEFPDITQWMDNRLDSEDDEINDNDPEIKFDNEQTAISQNDPAVRLQDLQSEFANYRRRIEKEKETQIKCANEELILKLLPVLDDFSLALNAVPEEEKNLDWIKGILLIRQKLMAVLEKQGLEKIDAEGREFDPYEHEAILCDEDMNSEGERVKLVMRDGYKLNNRVIQPAQVIVSV